MALKILDPTAERELEGRPLAARSGSPATVALLDIRKPRGDVFLDEVESLAVSRTGASLESLLAASDIVVCALPLTAQTDSLLDARAFALMPPGTMLCGCGYLPHTSTHISRARRVTSSASR